MNSKEILLECYNKGYSVDKEGNVWYKNKKRNTHIRYIKHIPYKELSFRIEKKVRNIRVHKLQAYQKYGDKIFEAGIEIRHLNSNSLDNSYDNIAIGSHSENMLDKPKELRVKQANIATSYIRKHNHEEIYNYYIECKSYIETMKKFNISSKGTLYFILNKYK